MKRMISPHFLGESLRQGKHVDVSSRRCNYRGHRKREQKVKLGKMGSKYLLASLQEETQPALSMRNTDRQACRKPQTCMEAMNPTGINPPPPTPFCFLSHTGNGCLSENLALPPLNTLAYITRNL